MFFPLKNIYSLLLHSFFEIYMHDYGFFYKDVEFLKFISLLSLPSHLTFFFGRPYSKTKMKNYRLNWFYIFASNLELFAIGPKQIVLYEYFFCLIGILNI